MDGWMDAGRIRSFDSGARCPPKTLGRHFSGLHIALLPVFVLPLLLKGEVSAWKDVLDLCRVVNAAHSDPIDKLIVRLSRSKSSQKGVETAIGQGLLQQLVVNDFRPVCIWVTHAPEMVSWEFRVWIDSWVGTFRLLWEPMER